MMKLKCSSYYRMHNVKYIIAHVVTWTSVRLFAVADGVVPVLM